MSNFRFRCLIDDYLCDIAPFEPYIEKGSVDSGLILISFDETEIDTIRTLFKDNVHNGQEAYLDKIQLAGTDDYLYIMSQSSLEKKEKMPHSVMKTYRYYESYKKKQIKADDYIRNETENNDISKFNPSISLAAFMVCYGNRTSLYERIIKEGVEYLQTSGDISGDDINCYLLAYELLTNNGIDDIIDMNVFKDLLNKAIENCICKDIEKYGVEYVPMPSAIFAGRYLDFITPEIKLLISAEINSLSKLQMEDGGFDITWKWYTSYPNEYEQARAWWRPRITIEKLLFNEIQIGESL